MDTVRFDAVIVFAVSVAAVLGLTSLFVLYLGRHTKSSDDWAVGGRALPVYVVVGSHYATAMGGGVLVAHVGVGYASGWAVLTYGLLFICGLLLLAIAGPWLRSHGFSTLPDVIQKLYGRNKVLLAIVALACMMHPFGTVCTQIVAFGKLFAAYTGLPVPALMVAMAAVGLLFVMPAGLKSVAWTDFVFGCLMLVMSLASAIFALKLGGGWQAIVDKVPQSNIAFPQGMGSVGGAAIALWALAVLPGTLTNQLYYQRIFATGNKRLVRISLVVSAAVAGTAMIWAAVVGICIRAANPDLPPEMAGGWFVRQLPSWFLVFYLGFIAATIVSTADSAVQSVVVNLSSDIFKNLLFPRMTDRTLLRVSRVLALVVTVVALILGLAWSEALGWLVASYAYSASALLFPIAAGFILRKTDSLTTEGAISGIVGGTCGCAIAQALDTTIPYAAFGLAASFVSLTAGSILAKRYRLRGKRVLAETCSFSTESESVA